MLEDAVDGMMETPVGGGEEKWRNVAMGQSEKLAVAAVVMTALLELRE